MDMNPCIKVYADHFVTEIQELVLGGQKTSKNLGISRRIQRIYISYSST